MYRFYVYDTYFRKLGKGLEGLEGLDVVNKLSRAYAISSRRWYLWTFQSY